MNQDIETIKSLEMKNIATGIDDDSKLDELNKSLSNMQVTIINQANSAANDQNLNSKYKFASKIVDTLKPSFSIEDFEEQPPDFTISGAGVKISQIETKQKR